MWFRSFLYTVNPVNVKFGIYGKYGNYDSYIREVAQLKINNLTHKQYFLRTHPRTYPKSPQELVCKSILPENQHSIYNYAACRFCRFCRFQTVNSDKNDTLRTYHFRSSRLCVFKKKFSYLGSNTRYYLSFVYP